MFNCGHEKLWLDKKRCMTNRLTQHPAFQAPLRYAQFAKNSVWEQAWRFDKLTIPDWKTIDDYLNGAEEVAFEVFFGDAFFGLRFNGTAEEVKRSGLACVKAYQSECANGTFFSSLSLLLNTPSWGQNVAYAEVGAVNFWKSVKPYRLPDLKKAQNNPAAIFQDLLVTPVGLDRRYPKALELVCDGPIAHWFGFPVSLPESPYRPSGDLFTAALLTA